ncbi:TPA: dUTPase [Staphylococcus aureus]|nr:dUTPase [Staphylococcus aureus]
MNNTLTIDQLQELLQIQKEFDDRIPTRNLNDTVASMIIEFVEWVNTLEFFKNWKKQPGKPLDTQLDEIADYLAFGLQLTLTIVNEEDLEETTEVMVDLFENEVTLPKLHSVYFVHVMHTLTEQFVKGIDNSIVQVLIMPFLYANTYYSIDQLIDAYKKKMKRNHERQDGTADAGKGYV